MKKQGQRWLRCDKTDERIFSRKLSKATECWKGGKHILMLDVLSCIDGCGKLKSEKNTSECSNQKFSITLLINILSKEEIRLLWNI